MTIFSRKSNSTFTNVCLLVCPPPSSFNLQSLIFNLHPSIFISQPVSFSACFVYYRMATFNRRHFYRTYSTENIFLFSDNRRYAEYENIEKNSPFWRPRNSLYAPDKSEYKTEHSQENKIVCWPNSEGTRKLHSNAPSVSTWSLSTETKHSKVQIVFIITTIKFVIELKTLLKWQILFSLQGLRGCYTN